MYYKDELINEPHPLYKKKQCNKKYYALFLCLWISSVSLGYLLSYIFINNDKTHLSYNCT